MARIPGVRRLFRLDRGAQDVDHAVEDELAFHLEMSTRELMARGMSPDAARREAARRFGDVERTRVALAAIDRDTVGARRRGEWLDGIWRDLRYAARRLRLEPGFTAAVVLTLALGIGANAAIFSVVDRLLFRPPPMLAAPARTHRVYLATTYRGKEVANGGVQYARWVDLTRDTRSFDRTAEVTERALAIGTGDEAREMQVGIVSAGFFGFFDAPPALGRYFTAREDQPPSGTPVAVLSYGLWQTRFGGRPDVLGATLRIGATVYTIIGVAPRGFVGLWPSKPPVAFIPISSYAGTIEIRLHGEQWWSTYHWTWAEMLVQRKPGVTLVAATADLTDAFRRSYEAEAAAGSERQPVAIARPHAIAASILDERGPNQSSLGKVARLVGGMALLVLLIACANVANLLLARALRRRREIAVRLALGVSRARLLSQLFLESALLAALGGVAGVLVAQWGGALLRAAFLPKGAEASVLGDGRTLLFTGLAALAAGLLTGLAPAWHAGRVELASDLKAGVREGTYHRSRARAALLVMQGALSVVLLVGAGLFVRSLRNVRSLRLGYDVTPVLLVEPNMRGVHLDSARAVTLRRDLLAAAERIPEVEHAALHTSVPFWSTWDLDLHVAGIDSVRRLGEFDLNAVTPDYFATMGTRLVRGRGIEARDVAGAPRAMVVSESMARALWPARDPIGECVKVGADTMPCTYVVGIAEDIKNNSLGDDPSLYYYLSSDQFHPDQTGLLVRVRGDAAAHADAIRRRLQRVMPGASYVTVTPFSDVIGGEMRSWRVGATMFTVFGALALALAAVGLYGVVAYDVVQRTHEMGVRVALGARAADVVRLVLVGGLRLAAVGVLLGGAIALAGARWVAPLLFQEPARDPVVFGGVAAVLMAVAAAAATLPAWRAARVDPLEALRSE
ncbi:MAG TPA: ABC transporter permease [Gemmatimonadaceae bacterium]|nr:ABC transporter permease [Gemmatimonadaceae bacterium]